MRRPGPATDDFLQQYGDEKGKSVKNHERKTTNSNGSGVFGPLQTSGESGSRRSAAAPRRAAARLLMVAALASFAYLLLPGPASAASEPQPWWNLNASVRPAVIPTGGEGSLVVRASNVGNSCTAEPNEQGDRCGVGATPIPSTLTATLPAGLSVVEEGGVPQVSFFAFSKQAGAENFGPTSFLGEFGKFCNVVAQQVDCKSEAIAPFNEFEAFQIPPLNPYEWLEMRIKVKDTGAVSGTPVQAEVSGGGAATVAAGRPIPIGSGPPPFGAEEYTLVPEEQGGSVDAHAGSHPYQLTTTFGLNQKANEAGPGEGERYTRPPGLARNLNFRLPPGQIGNATAVPQCSALDFAHVPQGGEENLCPADTVIGVASVSVDEPLHVGLATFPVPLYNLKPKFGEPARFGFSVVAAPVVLDTSVRSGKGEDYGVTVSTLNTSQLVNFISATVTFWGTPGDPSHDISRGWSCLVGGHWAQTAGRGLPCELQKQAKPPAFLTLPTNCAAPFASTVEGDSWTNPTSPERQFLAPFTYSLQEGGSPLGLVGCNQLPFAPQIHSEPTSNSATSPTGLNFDIDVDDEGLSNPEGTAQSQLKKAVVTLPEGFTTNPSVAEGLKACSEAEYDAATVEAGTGCTEESKVGEVEIESPLVEPVVHGSLYVAKQGENPNPTPQNPRGNLLTLYMVARNAEVGVVVKQALRVTPNPVTGQLTTEVDNVPQLPFSRFHLSFRQGQRSPLVTPPTCGTYTVAADLYPWSNPGAPVHDQSSFQITGGPEGNPCPNGTPPFHPLLEAGSQNNAAGSYSPFYTRISRKDSEQEITRFSIKLPTGMIAKLKGVSECSDAQIAQAKSREVEGGGTVEQEHPSCPANSEIGHSLVGSGVGNVLAYAPGKLYLAGPYHGSPLSLVSVTAAKVGPFDLGTVVVRFAIDVNHETAEVSVDGANSDPIPHIVDGIPIHLRDIRAYVSTAGLHPQPDQLREEVDRGDGARLRGQLRQLCRRRAGHGLEPLPGGGLRLARLQAEPGPQPGRQEDPPWGAARLQGGPHLPEEGRLRQHRQSAGDAAGIGVPRTGPPEERLHEESLRNREEPRRKLPEELDLRQGPGRHPAARPTARRPGLPAHRLRHQAPRARRRPERAADLDHPGRDDRLGPPEGHRRLADPQHLRRRPRRAGRKVRARTERWQEGPPGQLDRRLQGDPQGAGGLHRPERQARRIRTAVEGPVRQGQEEVGRQEEGQGRQGQGRQMMSASLVAGRTSILTRQR